MNDLNTIIQQNREAAKILPGFKGVGVDTPVTHRNETPNRARPNPATHDTYVNPRTGAVVGIPRN